MVDKIVLCHGTQKSIITDRGKCVLSDIAQNVWEKIGRQPQNHFWLSFTNKWLGGTYEL